MGEERETAGRSEVGLPRFYSNNLQNSMFLIIFLLYLAHFQMIVYTVFCYSVLIFITFVVKYGYRK